MGTETPNMLEDREYPNVISNKSTMVDPIITKPSCFGKKLGVEACFNDICKHSDECYREGE